MNERLKIYLETSFVSYITGRPTTKEPIAAWQAASRQWWAAVAPLCDLFVSGYVITEAKKGNPEQVAQRLQVVKGLAELNIEPTRIGVSPRNALWRTVTMTSEVLESPIDEIYRIRQELSAQYDHDPHKLYCAVLEEQRERARHGQVYWGYNAAGELAPLPTDAVLAR